MRTKDNELVNRIKLYIEDQIDRKGRMPTIRDIAEALDVGKSSVQRYLEYMVEQGILKRCLNGHLCEAVMHLAAETAFQTMCPTKNISQCFARSARKNGKKYKREDLR